MSGIIKFIKTRLSEKQNHVLLSLAVSLILVIILIRLPEPGTFSGQHWRVEILLSGLILILFGKFLYLDRQTECGSYLIVQPLRRILILCAAFIAFSALSVFWAVSWRAVAHHTLTWAIYLILTAALFVYLQHKRNLGPIFTVFIFTSLILLFNNGFDLITVIGIETDVQHPRIRYAKYAELLVTIAPLIWIISVYWKQPARYLFFLLAGAISWIAVMLSLGRGAFLAGVCSFIFCFTAAYFFSNKSFRNRVLVSAFCWILLTGAFQVAFTFGSSLPSTAEFISGAAEPKRETAHFRVFTTKVSGIMFAENALLGVGANNYGIAFNGSRMQFAKLFPDDIGNSIAEDHMVERAHNEYLQIFAELGIIGGGIFLLIMMSFAGWIARCFKLNNYKFSPVLLGSLAGVTAFLISSLFSSFSFRLMQNGVVFVMVLSILIYQLLKIEKRNTSVNRHKSSRFLLNRPALVAACATLIAMIGFSAVTAASNYYVYLGENEPDFDMAMKDFDRSLSLNPENASAHISKGFRLFAEKRMDQSALHLQRAVDLGLGTVVSYSYLAAAYEKSGNGKAGETILRESVGIYPRSVFLRVRFAAFLEAHGKSGLSEKEMAIARKLNEKDSAGWYNLIKFRSEKAFRLAMKNDSITKPGALVPNDAALQYLDKPKMGQTAKNTNSAK